MITGQDTLTGSPLRVPSESIRFIARQPIFDRSKNVYGYELLFRSGLETVFQGNDPEIASCTTMDRSLLLGTDWLTRGKRAFVNCTRDLLVRELVTLLPPDRTVLEVLETVEPDEEVVRACEKLKRAGYVIALDDYDGHERWGPLLDLADIIKVDFKLIDIVERHRTSQRFHGRKVSLLAEKVETNEEFEWARKNGYRYFQGYFFCRPTTLSNSDVPTGHVNCLQILESLSASVLNIDHIEGIIKRDPSLCYRLLRYLNSAAFGVFPIRSVRHALLLLGENELRKWISVVVAATIAKNKPGELLLNALTRASFCESVAKRTLLNSPELFLVGLFSLMDALLDMPMDRLINRVPLSDACKNALMGEAGEYGDVLKLGCAFESGDWDIAAKTAAKIGLEEQEAYPLHVAALQWSSHVTVA